MLTADEYQQAELEYAVAEARRGFTIHAVVYGIVMTGLACLNALLIVFTEADFPWVVFPLLGWGIGLTLHYIAAFRRGDADVRVRQETIEGYARRHVHA